MNETVPNLSAYRLYRSNALWFAARKDGYSAYIGDDQYVTFEKGSMKKCALDWLERSREYWQRLLSAHVVSTSCTGMRSTSASIAQSATLLPATDCICPECTFRKIEKVNK